MRYASVPALQEALVAVAVDEAHSVNSWYVARILTQHFNLQHFNFPCNVGEMNFVLLF